MGLRLYNEDVGPLLLYSTFCPGAFIFLGPLGKASVFFSTFMTVDSSDLVNWLFSNLVSIPSKDVTWFSPITSLHYPGGLMLSWEMLPETLAYTYIGTP